MGHLLTYEASPEVGLRVKGKAAGIPSRCALGGLPTAPPESWEVSGFRRPWAAGHQRPSTGGYLCSRSKWISSSRSRTPTEQGLIPPARRSSSHTY